MSISKAPQAFPRREYLRRLGAVRSKMARREIEALDLFVAAHGYVSYPLE